jgi:Helix-turn-helix domain
MIDAPVSLGKEAARQARLAQGLMTPTEAANYVATTEMTLRWYRCRGGGPPYHKDGGRYFYLRNELDAYRAARGRA